MNQELVHFLNGTFVAGTEPVVSIHDLGFARGYAVFDFLITYPHHRPFMLQEHVSRLFRSAKMIDLIPLWTERQVCDWILETLAKNENAEEKTVKIVMTGGISHAFDFKSEGPTIAIIVEPRVPLPPELYQIGFNIMTVEHERYIPEAKTNNYIEAVRQLRVAGEKDAHDIVYYNSSQVFEASRSNIFALIDGELRTTKTNILSGITKEVLLKILKLPVPVVEKDFSLQELQGADEVFLTASNLEIMPVTKINGNPVGAGIPGPLTLEAMKQFEAHTTSGNW